MQNQAQRGRVLLTRPRTTGRSTCWMEPRRRPKLEPDLRGQALSTVNRDRPMGSLRSDLIGTGSGAVSTGHFCLDNPASPDRIA